MDRESTGVAQDGVVEAERVDVATIGLGSRVHAIVNARYYGALLATLQEEAGKFGLEFRKGAGPEPTVLLPEVEQALALAVARRRLLYVAPDRTDRSLAEEIEWEMTSGCAGHWLIDLLASLRVLGIELVAAPGPAAAESGGAGENEIEAFWRVAHLPPPGDAEADGGNLLAFDERSSGAGLPSVASTPSGR